MSAIPQIQKLRRKPVKNFFLFLLVGKRIANALAYDGVFVVGKRLCDCVSRSRYSSFFRARVSCSASPSLSVSVCLEVAGSVLLLTGLSEQREGNHMGVRERSPALERFVPRYPCLLSLNLFRYEYALVRLCVFQCGLSAPGVSKCRPPRNIARSCGYI